MLDFIGICVFVFDSCVLCNINHKPYNSLRGLLYHFLMNVYAFCKLEGLEVTVCDLPFMQFFLAKFFSC